MTPFWDFSRGMTKNGIQDIDHVKDVSVNGLIGELVNTPMRAATGYNW